MSNKRRKRCRGCSRLSDWQNVFGYCKSCEEQEQRAWDASCAAADLKLNDIFGSRELGGWEAHGE